MRGLQEWIHALEEGTGAPRVRQVAAVLILLALAAIYDFRFFKNFETEEAMDAAQVARNVAQGRGFSTYNLRPLSLELAREHSGRDTLDLSLPHPDLANPPLYPLLLAGWMRLLPFDYDLADARQVARPYKPEVTIAVFNQFLFVLTLFLVFRLALRLFDEPVAWLSVAALAGSDLLWRFTMSGLPTNLLLLIFVGIVWVLVMFNEAAEAAAPLWRRAALAAAAALLVALGGLSRYSFAILILALVVFLILHAGPNRGLVTALAITVFSLAMAPWLARNHRLSGTLFGTAGYAICQQTEAFPGDSLLSSSQPAPTVFDLGAKPLVRKMVLGTRDLVEREIPRLGGSWLGAVFLASLLIRFRAPILNRLRGFLLLSLILLSVAQVASMTRGAPESSGISPDSLVLVIVPMTFVFGAALILMLVDQLAISFPPWRWWLCAGLAGLLALPVLLRFLPPRGMPVSYPPYHPWVIRTSAQWLRENQLMMSDLPAAVAWYGERHCLRLTANAREAFFAIHDQKSVSALYLSPKFMGTEFSKMLSRPRSGQIIRWESVVMEVLTRKEVPQGFPLKSVMVDWLPEHMLMADYERWNPALNSR